MAEETKETKKIVPWKRNKKKEGKEKEQKEEKKDPCGHLCYFSASCSDLLVCFWKKSHAASKRGERDRGRVNRGYL